MSDSKQIEQHAAAWLARRDSGVWGAQEEAQLEEWLQASTAHYIAFIRLEAAWEHGLRLKALSAGEPPGVVPPPGQWKVSPFVTQQATPGKTRRGWIKPAAIAAGIVMFVAGGFFWLNTSFNGDRYATPVGGIASLPMADGSKITLNTDSEIRVALDDSERLIELKQGEAFFEVARDPNRPFVVNVGRRRVVAVGTQFSVRRQGEEIRVVVTEGLVRLENKGGDSAEAPQLAVGAVAHVRPDKVLIESKTIPEAEDTLSWRTGYLVFHEHSLGEAVAEFNRYNTQHIVIADPSVATIRFSGKFRAANLDAFVRIMESAFPIEATTTPERIVLAARR